MKENGGQMAEGGGMKENGERSDLRDRTKQFALRIIRLYTALPKSTEAR
jgi:hypothetical protein